MEEGQGGDSVTFAPNFAERSDDLRPGQEGGEGESFAVLGVSVIWDVDETCRDEERREVPKKSEFRSLLRTLIIAIKYSEVQTPGISTNEGARKVQPLA